MAKKSKRLFLPVDDISQEDLDLEMARLEGTLDMPVSEIVGSDPGVISKAVADEHEEVLKRSMEKWVGKDEKKK